MLASGCVDNTVRLWGVRARRRVWNYPDLTRSWVVVEDTEIARLQGHEDRVDAVAFHPRGDWLVSASRDGTLRFWAPGPAPAVPRLLGHGTSVQGVAWHPTKNHFLATIDGNGELRTWNTSSGEAIQEVALHFKPPRELRFSPGGKFLAIASGDQQASGFESQSASGVQLYRARDDGRLEKVDERTVEDGGPPFAVAFSNDEGRLAVASHGGLISICALTAKGALSTLKILECKGRSVRALAFLDAEGRWLAAGGCDWSEEWQSGTGAWLGEKLSEIT